MVKGSKTIKDEPWANNSNLTWLASTFALHRNVEKFAFPGKLDESQRKQIVGIISKHLLNHNLLKKPVLLKMEDISPTEKELFAEHFLTTHSFQGFHSGEAFVIDDTGSFLASINVDNHLLLELIDTRGELENSWDQLLNIEITLGKNFNYAFSPRFGFLTSDPTLSGTGFVLSTFLQPSALIHTNKIHEAIEGSKNDRLSFSSIQGNIEEFVGDVLVVKNNYTLGVTVENIISSLRLFTTKLLSEENSARNQLKQIENGEVMDKVSRAFGMLVHSYRMETREALNEIGLVKLGLDLGWIEGTTPAALNHLFFHCRRAHLLTNMKNGDLPSDQIPHKRAEFIHRTLKDAKLKI